MKAVIRPGQLDGELTIPASKSAMQRAYAAALLTIGTSHIYNPGKSQDDQAALSIIQQLGAKVTIKEDHIVIDSDGIEGLREHQVSSIDCGESGLSVRMFTPIAALTSQPVTMTGKGSLTQRPLDFFEKTLPQLQVQVSSQNGKLPITVHGPLVPQDLRVDGSLSSQYITGLLMAYAVSAQDMTQLQVLHLTSAPYVELTLSVMQQFEMNSPHVDRLEHFTFSAYQAEKKNIQFTVESDWSSASFFIVGAAIAGHLTLKGLNSFSTQADASILDVLDEAVIDYDMDDEDNLIVRQTDHIQPFEFDATDSPDLFPPLVVLASCAEGISSIKGTQRLLHKESNRLYTLTEEFTKLGVTFRHEDDTLFITGQSILQGDSCSSHHDHRIAMALGIAGLRCAGPLEISDAQAVSKSYPEFWEHFQQLGGDVSFM